MLPCVCSVTDDGQNVIRTKNYYSVLVDVFRPHWEKCGQYVEGGADRWNDLSQDRSSDELVDILLAEMTGQDIAIIQAGVNTGAEYFTGQVYN